MKIAVSCHASQGGSGIVAAELAVALAAAGHEVHMVADRMPFRFREEKGLYFHKVNVTDYPLFPHPPHDLSLANKLAQVTREFGVELIHAHYAVPHAVTALLARQIVDPLPVAVVTTLHGTDITLVGSHSDFYDLTRHAIRQSDAVSAVSGWLSEETAQRFCLDEPPVVIPNFVDSEHFNARNRFPYPEPGQEMTLLHASNMRPVKRITYMIRVFASIVNEVPARLVVLGEGPQKGLARELVSELGLNDRVSFNGISRNMSKVLKEAHLYFLLSDYESFGLSALEAMACGTPVAVSAAGGLPEVVTHNETGLLCPNQDAPFTARGILNLLKSPERWNEMSIMAARVAKERFALNKVVPRYEKLYEQAIKRRKNL